MHRIKYYIAFYIAKLVKLGLKIIKRDATYLPGKIAVTICPDFIGQIDKPETIICVTGTNGKTTVCNMINDVLEDNKIEVLNNRLGSNINAGIASSLIDGASLSGKQKKKLAVFEVDERSSKKIYPYMKPNYIVCTNLFRDSIKRNAHTEFIASILNEAIPKDTKMILNGDDLISSNIAPNNDRVYFGISRLDTDTKEAQNIVRDIIVCPKCNHKLEYDYVRYNHIGKAHCTNCDFASPKVDYLVTNLDFEKMNMTLVHNEEKIEYPLVSNNIINIYNMLAMITVLKEFGIEEDKLIKSISKLKIVETRFSEENIDGIKVIMHLAKGQNPIPCSRVFDYVKKEEGKKAVILLLDDLHEAVNSSENVTWLYDTDFEFLKEENICQIVVGGARYLDDKVRLLMAGIEEEKIICMREEKEVANNVMLEGIDKIFILHDLYAFDLAKKVKEKIRHRIEEKKEGGKGQNED